MPALVATILAFSLILVLIRLRLPLALALLSGAAVLGLLQGLTVTSLVRTCTVALLEPMTVSVSLAVLLLLTISEVMQRGGDLAAIVEATRSIIGRPALTAAALPALIGLLPMPGGALFSAPMVAAAAGTSANRERLAAVNYWFRHVWEYFWPLYPGVMLAAALSDNSLVAIVVFQLPLGVVMALAGAPLLRTIDLRMVESPDGLQRAPGAFLRATSTLVVIIGVWASGSIAVSLVTSALGASSRAAVLGRYGPILLGLLVGLGHATRRSGTPCLEAMKIFASGRALVMAGVVAAIMVFQTVLTHSGAAGKIAAEMASHGLPAVVVVMALPFLAGAVTGVAMGFVGASFPIVVALSTALPGTSSVHPWVVLAYACGHIGMMASPIHLCYVLSNRYFEVAAPGVYRHLAFPLAIQAACALGYATLLSALAR